MADGNLKLKTKQPFSLSQVAFCRSILLLQKEKKKKDGTLRDFPIFAHFSLPYSNPIFALSHGPIPCRPLEVLEWNIHQDDGLFFSLPSAQYVFEK